MQLAVNHFLGQAERIKMNLNLHGISEVAKTLGVSNYTIRRLIDAGEIKAVNIGTRRLVPTSEVERVAREGAGGARTVDRSGCKKINAGKSHGTTRS